MTTTHQTPTEIILSQIPFGARARVGVRELTWSSKDPTWLEFRVGPSNPHRIVRIQLNGHDMYDITCWKVNRTSFHRVVEYETFDIFFDQIEDILLIIEKAWG